MKGKNRRLAAICRQFQISLLYLFGSQKSVGLAILQGNYFEVNDPLTDIDVGVIFSDKMPSGVQRTKLYSKIYNTLQDLFLPLSLDLVFLEENHSVFQAESVKGICVYSISQNAQELYEEDILRRACDFKPYLEKYYEELLEAYQ